MDLNKYNNYSLLKQNNIEHFVETANNTNKIYNRSELNKNLDELTNFYTELTIKYICPNKNGSGTCKSVIGSYIGNIINNIKAEFKKMCVYQYNKDSFKVVLNQAYTNTDKNLNAHAKNAAKVYKKDYQDGVYSRATVNLRKSLSSEKSGDMDLYHKIISTLNSQKKSMIPYEEIYNLINGILEEHKKTLTDASAENYICHNNKSAKDCLKYIHTIYNDYIININSIIENNLVYTDDIVNNKMKPFLDSYSELSGVKIAKVCDDCDAKYDKQYKSVANSKCLAELSNLVSDIKLSIYSNKASSVRLIKELVYGFESKISGLCVNNNCDNKILDLIYDNIYNNVVENEILTINVLLDPINKEIFNNYYNTDLKVILRELKDKIMDNNDIKGLVADNFTNTEKNIKENFDINTTKNSLLDLINKYYLLIIIVIVIVISIFIYKNKKN